MRLPRFTTRQMGFSHVCRTHGTSVFVFPVDDRGIAVLVDALGQEHYQGCDFEWRRDWYYSDQVTRSRSGQQREGEDGK